jgi:hypothetical protein
MLRAVPRGAAGLACLAAVTVAQGCAGGGTRARAQPAPAWAAVADTTGMTRVRFARGTTSGILDDSLPAGGERAYLLGALQGQVMLAHAIAWTDPARGRAGATTIRVFRPDGAELTAPGGSGPLWTGRLPLSGDYVVRVRAAGGAAAYTLAVQIPRRVVVDRENPSTSFAGLAPSRAPVDYLIKGERGRTLDVELRSEDGATHLHVYGLDDGAQLARLADRQRRFGGALPSTQDYVVSVVPAAEGARYELLVTLR